MGVPDKYFISKTNIIACGAIKAARYKAGVI
jgi:hypothetical protein